MTRDGPTDGLMDGQTDRKSDIYRWAPHLKILQQMLTILGHYALNCYPLSFGEFS